MSTFKNFAGKQLAVAALALSAAASGALAGGDAPGYGPPIRTRVPEAVAVPVPAPVPVPETHSGYYVRLDAAYSQSPLKKYQSTDPFADTVRTDSYLNNFPRFGIGAGYQFNRWFRMDATVDWRNDVKSRGTGTRNYTVPNTAGGVDGGGNPLPATIQMRDTVSDGFTSTNLTGLINAYVDIPVTQRVTPYFGLGLGFVRHQLKGRNYSSTTTCIDPTDCDPNTVDAQPGSAALNSTRSALAGGTDYALAAAAMAGLTYKIWDNTKLDLGYRYLYLGGTAFADRRTGSSENIKLPDQSVHELRVGLRYEIN